MTKEASQEVWIDTNDGAAGTEAHVNGTADNPVLSLADALVIATQLGTKKLRIVDGSCIKLTADATSYEFIGDDWLVDMNGQQGDGLFIQGATILGHGRTIDGLRLELNDEYYGMVRPMIEAAFSVFGVSPRIVGLSNVREYVENSDENS